MIAIRLVLQLCLGVALGGVVELFPRLLPAVAERVSLELWGAMAFLAGLVHGPLGAFGYGIGAELVHGASTGQRFHPLVAFAAFLLGAGAFAMFRYVARVDRRLPDLRSYTLLAAAAGLVTLPTSVLLVRLHFREFAWTSVGVWATALLASILLVVPPFLVLCPEALWRLRHPMAKEDKRAARRAPVEGRAVGDSSGSFRLARPSRRLADAAIVVSVVAAVHLAVGVTSPGAAFAHWLFVLYVLPILFGAWRHGLRGGILASALVGLSLLLSVHPAAPNLGSHFAVLERHGAIILFSLVGAVAGATRDRELALTRQMERSNRYLRRDLERVLAALRSAMEAKDQYTEGHLRRVCAFAVEVGRRLKLPPRELELLEIASLLHDVGKIGIADSVLHKPGPLESREREVMQRHPEIGARILENIEGLHEAAEMVRHHQERFDGETSGDFPGYPAGLSGREIPLGARIIAVVDAFDAMTSDRPYRHSIGYDRARTELRGESGRQFDPRVVETFLAVLDENPWDGGAEFARSLAERAAERAAEQAAESDEDFSEASA